MVEELTFQCVRCTFVMHAEEKPRRCSECECPMIREVAPGEPLDVASEEAVAHLRKKVVNCMNYAVDPVTKNRTFHKLKIIHDPSFARVVRGIPEKSFLEITDRCEKCKTVYTKLVIPTTPSNREILQSLGLLDKVEKILSVKLEFPEIAQ